MVNLLHQEPRLRAVWSQSTIPVIYRSGEVYSKLILRLPYDKSNRDWIRGERKTQPTWISDKKHWEIPKAWFNQLVERALHRFQKLYIIQPYREQEKCAPACMNALGHECQCSCMGANHGMGNDGSWFEISETFATRWHQKELACRLMTARETGRAVINAKRPLN